MKKSTRMSDIAQQLGISTVSVSKALAGKPGVSEETRTKVIALARQMGYSGVHIRYESGLTGNIGVVVTDRIFSKNMFYTDLYREIVIHTGKSGFACIMEILTGEDEQAAVLPLLMAEQRVDGVLFMGEINPAYLENSVAAEIPCILLDYRVPGLQIDSVCRDNEEGGFLLTKHLLSAGYERIGFAGDIGVSDDIMERYLGYQWALHRSGAVPKAEWLWRDQEAEQGAFSASGEQPEAFICSSYETALHLMNAWQRSGRQEQPEPVLACFGDFRDSVHFGPRLTSYQVETRRMAETAVCRLVRRIRGEDLSPVSCVIPGQLSVV